MRANTGDCADHGNIKSRILKFWKVQHSPSLFPSSLSLSLPRSTLASMDNETSLSDESSSDGSEDGNAIVAGSNQSQPSSARQVQDGSASAPRGTETNDLKKVRAVCYHLFRCLLFIDCPSRSCMPRSYSLQRPNRRSSSRCYPQCPRRRTPGRHHLRVTQQRSQHRPRPQLERPKYLLHKLQPISPQTPSFTPYLLVVSRS